jgi:hypothetical protein
MLKIAGDADGCDDNSDASEDGRMGIEGDAGGDDGDYDGDTIGLYACGGGGDGNGGEDGGMGLEADSGAVSEVEGGVDGAGKAAAPAAAIGLLGNSKSRRRPGKRRGHRPGDQRARALN